MIADKCQLLSTFQGRPFCCQFDWPRGTLVILVHKKIKLLRLGGIVAALQLKLYAVLSIRFFYFCFDIKKPLNLSLFVCFCIVFSNFCTSVRNFCTWFRDFCMFGVGGYAGRPCVICIFPAGSFSARCYFRIGGACYLLQSSTWLFRLFPRYVVHCSRLSFVIGSNAYLYYRCIKRLKGPLFCV